MTRARGRKKRRVSGGSGSLWIGAAALGLLVLAASGAFGYFVWQAYANRITLNQNLCRPEGPGSQTIVLVDATDALHPLTQTEILTLLEDVADGVPTNGLLELRTLEPGEQRSEVLFALCNPGTGEELSEITAAPALARKRWVDSFNAPLEAAMAQVVSASQADSSPIMAALQQIAVERLTSARDRATPSRIIVISDMLEHTPDFSIYQSGPDFAAFEQSRSARANATNLSAAEVEIWYLHRETRFSSVDVVQFWTQWVSESGGVFKHAIPMQGLQP